MERKEPRTRPTSEDVQWQLVPEIPRRRECLLKELGTRASALAPEEGKTNVLKSRGRLRHKGKMARRDRGGGGFSFGELTLKDADFSSFSFSPEGKGRRCGAAVNYTWLVGARKWLEEFFGVKRYYSTVFGEILLAVRTEILIPEYLYIRTCGNFSNRLSSFILTSSQRLENFQLRCCIIHAFQATLSSRQSTAIYIYIYTLLKNQQFLTLFLREICRIITSYSESPYYVIPRCARDSPLSGIQTSQTDDVQ